MNTVIFVMFLLFLYFSLRFRKLGKIEWKTEIFKTFVAFQIQFYLFFFSVLFFEFLCNVKCRYLRLLFLDIVSFVKVR